jgi:CubicO group peptidase (beta-lactamase class C family)
MFQNYETVLEQQIYSVSTLGNKKRGKYMKNKIIIIALLCALFVIATTPTVFSEIEINQISNKNSINEKFIDNTIINIMEKCHYPSISACVIKNDEVVWSNTYGFADIENNIEASDETVYTIGSTTKTITAAALMQLYDQGLFNLDDDVNEFLPFELRNPNFPDKPITFRMILSHTSSLKRDPNAYWLEVENWYEYDGPPFDNYPMPWLQEYLTPSGNRYDPLIWNEEYGPGEKSQYGNINYDIVAFLVEILSEEPFYEYCENNIFEPLDMKSTSFHINNYDEEQLATPYVWDHIEQILLKGTHQMHIHYAVGFLFTTAIDLSHFLIAHMNNGVYNGTRILTESAVEEMHKIQTPKGGLQYGLGWHFSSRSFWLLGEHLFYSPNNYIFNFPNLIYSGHGGDAHMISPYTYGVGTLMHMKESDNSGVIIFSNNDFTFYKEGYNGKQILQELLFLKGR